MLVVALAAVVGATFSTPGWSRPGGGGGGHYGRWGYGERYHDYDGRSWRGGHWAHGWHGPRYGWWWIVGPTWFYYNVPVYPYPPVYTAPPVIVQPSAPTGPPPAQYWYYCHEPSGYYPYVTHCPGGWQAVPATPPK